MASRFSSFRPLLRTFTRSYWEGVPKGPEDPILGVTVAFQKDTNPKKINLGVGAYRDDNGKPFVLQSVQRAEKILTDQKLDHEYLPIGGLPAFTKAAAKLVFGPDSAPLSENRTVTVQTLSGTGALRVAGNFLARFLPSSTVYLPNPSWANHTPIFQDSGLKVASYPYYNPATCGLDFKGMVEGIKKAESNSVILLHACAHNPTGVDPSLEQWQELSKVIADKRHFVLFDLAYQGFASGDTNKDAAAVRLFVKDGHQVAVCQSFAKNFGLYGERIGALNFVAPSKTVAENVESQLKILIRPMYSNPPVTGARLVSTILNDAELNKLWLVEVKDMAERIIKMRSKLRDGLASRGSKRDWSHITNQIGMFCYTGISPEQVDKLASDYSVYLTRNGRISIAGITSHNVDYLAESIHGVTKGN